MRRALLWQRRGDRTSAAFSAGDDGRVLVEQEGRLVGIVSPSDVARASRLAELERAA
jgi:hypothetical protein